MPLIANVRHLEQICGKHDVVLRGLSERAICAREFP